MVLKDGVQRLNPQAFVVAEAPPGRSRLPPIASSGYQGGGDGQDSPSQRSFGAAWFLHVSTDIPTMSVNYII